MKLVVLMAVTGAPAVELVPAAEVLIAAVVLMAATVDFVPAAVVPAVVAVKLMILKAVI